MKAYELLKILLEYQNATSTPIYLVGGFIRDIILNKKSYDLDFTFRGEIAALYDLIKASHSAVICSDFQTMRFESVDGIHFDIATMRREIYNEDTKIYHHMPSTLKWDILRRDFTVNTAYVKLDESLCLMIGKYLKENEITKEMRHYLKTHIDACHPLFRLDLNQGIIRILHSKSFYEDPSRLLRAIKMKNQLNFHMEEMTLRKLIEGLKTNQIHRLSQSRIQIEFAKLFEGSSWQLNLETLCLYKGVPLVTNEVIVTVCTPSELKRIILMSNFEKHMPWLYGSDDQIKKCHQEYLGTFDAFSCFSEIDDYNLYKLLYNKRIETINLMAKYYKTLIMRYEVLLKNYKLEITGNDLIQIGIPQNHLMRELMDALLKYKLNHLVELSLEDEIKYIESIKHEY